MEIDDMNTMDVDTDTDYEPTDSAKPGKSVGEPGHEHSLGDNKSVVDKSPVSISDPHNDPTKVRPSIIGPREHPEALKTMASDGYTLMRRKILITLSLHTKTCTGAPSQNSCLQRTVMSFCLMLLIVFFPTEKVLNYLKMMIHLY